MTIEKRIERIEAILDARGLDWDHPRVASDHFADADKMVADEPPKKWRRLTDEFVQRGDWANAKGNRQDVDPPGGGWIPADPCYFGRRACTINLYFARPVTDEPAKEAEPAWEPKVGDWVLVTRPENWNEWKEPMWQEKMHHFDGKVLQVSGASETSVGHRVTLHGIDWFFHRDWLSPAEPPKDEYREPVLPADAGKYCQFSDDGIKWRSGWLNGWVERSHQWIARSGVHWQHARIKKDA